MTTVGVAFKADTRPLTRPVEALKGVSAKVASTIQRDLDGAFRSVAGSAEKASAQVERAGDRSSKAWREGLGPIKGLSSAVFGGVAGDAFDAAEAVGSADGRVAALGLTLGGIAIAGLGLVTVAGYAQDVGDNAVEATARLREQGLAIEAMVSPQALAHIDAYEASTDALATSSDIAAAELGGALAPSLTRVTDALIELTPAATKAAEGIDMLLAASEYAQPVTRGFIALMSGGSSELAAYGLSASAATGSVQELTAAEQRAAIEAAKVEARHADIALQLQETLAVERAATEATGEANRKRMEAARLAQARTTAQRELAVSLRHTSEASATLAGDLQREAEAERQAQITAGELAMQQAVVAENTRIAGVYMDSLIAQMKAAPEASLTFADAMAVARVALERGNRVAQAFGAAALEVFAASGSAAEQYAEKQERAIDRIRGRNKQLREERETASVEERAQIDKSLAANQAAIAAKEKAARQANQRAKRAFNAEKATKIAMAIANTAAATTAAFAPPPTGLGPVAGAFLATANAVVLGAQIDQIRKQKYTPTFASGGLVGARAGVTTVAPDHVPILADPREGIVNPRGMATIGEEGLDALNRGFGPGPQMVNVNANIVLNRRTIGEAVATVTGTGSARSGRVPVHT